MYMSMCAAVGLWVNIMYMRKTQTLEKDKAKPHKPGINKLPWLRFKPTSLGSRPSLLCTVLNMHNGEGLEPRLQTHHIQHSRVSAAG